MFDKILHANDGSEGAFKALATALHLAERCRAELHMVSVEEIQWVPGTREEVIGERQLVERKFDGVFARAKDEAKKQSVNLETHLLIGHPVKAIAEFAASKGFDALVIGYVGHSQLYNMLIGSTAEQLVRMAPCTVVVVK